MKYLIVSLSSLLFFLTSCNDAKFNRYPGIRLDSIPQQFRGVFRDPESKSKKKSEIIIGKNYWQENTKQTKNFLSDSNIISEYKGAYYFSILDKNTYWDVIYIKPSGKDIQLYMLQYDDKQPKDKNPILKYFTPAYDKDSNYVFTMDEEKLLQYSKTELLKLESTKLKRK